MAFSVIEIVHPLSILTGQWWSALFVLWIVPWEQPCAISKLWIIRVVNRLSALIVFGWLIFRLQTNVDNAVSTWIVFSSMPWWKLLSFPMQAAIAALVTAVLVMVPLRKIVGTRATTFVIVASLPYAIAWVPIRLSFPPAWTAHTAKAGIIDVGNAALSVLIISEISSLLTRFPFHADRLPGYRRLRIVAIEILKGNFNALIIFSLYCAVLAAYYWVGSEWLARYTQRDESLAGLATLLVLFTLTTGTLVLGAIAASRSLTRAGRRHVAGRILVFLGQLLIASGLLFALVELALVMPRIDNLLSEASRKLPGPAWSISPAAPGVLRLSGELQIGVSDALASALGHEPPIRQLELSSPGGDVSQGLALAALVEKYSLSTFVKGECSSACIVFVAGKDRVLTVGAKLGFHRSRNRVWDEALDYDDKANYQLIAYFESKGVAANFAQRAQRVPSDDIWYPTVDELTAAGIIRGQSISTSGK